MNISTMVTIVSVAPRIPDRPPFCSDKHILFFLMTNAWLVVWVMIFSFDEISRLVAIAIRFYYTVE